MMLSKRKYLTVTEKIKLLDYYEKENVSTPQIIWNRKTQTTDKIKKQVLMVLTFQKSNGNDEMKQ